MTILLVPTIPSILLIQKIQKNLLRFLDLFINGDNKRHPRKRYGLGVYSSLSISYAEVYSEIFELNEEKYKCALMLKENPKRIRQSNTL